MGMKFRKSINLGGGTKLNLSKSGVGISTGVKGFRVSKNTSGRSRVTASLPGTGLSYTKEYGSSGSSGNSQPAPVHHSSSYSGGGSAPSGGDPGKKDKPPFFQRTGIIILLLIFFPPVGICLMWRYMPQIHEGIKVTLSVAFGILFICMLATGGGDVVNVDQPPTLRQQADEAKTQPNAKTRKPVFVVDEPKPAQEPQETADPKTDVTTRPDAQTAQEPVHEPQDTSQAAAQPEAPKQEQPVQQEEFKDEERMVYITPTGEKYHKKTCRMIKGDCTEIGINDAIARGYTACGVCGG